MDSPTKIFTELRNDTVELSLLMNELNHLASVTNKLANEELAYGTHGLDTEQPSTFKDIKLLTSRIFDKLGRITTRIFKLLRNGSEKMLHDKEKLLTIWDTRISDKKIDIEKLHNSKLKCVPKNIFMDRLECVKQLIVTLEQTERIVNAPVVIGSNQSIPKEVIDCNSKLREIGFDIGNFNFVESTNKKYNTDNDTTGTITELGYDVVYIKKMIPIIAQLASELSKTKMEKLNVMFSNVQKKIMAEETAIKSNTDDRDNKKKLEILNIRIMKLWWLSHFISAMISIGTDLTNHMLKLAVLLDDCVSEIE